MNKTDRVAINLNINKISLNEKINLKSSIRRIPEFKGVVFWDITTLLKDPVIFKEAIKRLANYYRDKKIDVIVSNEARGFIIGAPLAYELGVGFVPIRKKGKLPYKCLD
jgi:adenine phosphoribosyltransferase